MQSHLNLCIKLETDSALLLPKSYSALERYKHNIVVANLLKDRKKEVIIVPREGEIDVLSVPDPATMEIEELLIKDLVKRHSEHIGQWKERSVYSLKIL